MLPLATSLTAFGFGALPKPQIFLDLAQTVWFPWVLTFVLIWQGGAKQDLVLSAIATLILFVIVRVADMVYPKKEKFYAH